jgi:hypothetical protein
MPRRLTDEPDMSIMVWIKMTWLHVGYGLFFPWTCVQERSPQHERDVANLIDRFDQMIGRDIIGWLLNQDTPTRMTDQVYHRLLTNHWHAHTYMTNRDWLCNLTTDRPTLCTCPKRAWLLSPDTFWAQKYNVCFIQKIFQLVLIIIKWPFNSAKKILNFLL